MAPANPKVAAAFRAMKDIGIPEKKVKPVLKKLLRLYDKNWELIEEENYRVLADAIFDEEESTVIEQKKSKDVDTEDLEDRAKIHDETHDEPERPLKRLRRIQEGPSSLSVIDGSPIVGGPLLKKPKVEEDETPAVSPKPLAVRERTDTFQTCAAHRTELCSSKRAEYDLLLPQVSAGYKGKELFPPHVASKERRHNSEGASDALLRKDPTTESGIIVLPEEKVPDAHVLIKPKDEPFTDEMAVYEVPIAVLHPDPVSEGGSPGRKIVMWEPNGQEAPASQHVEKENIGAVVQSSFGERITSSELATIPEESPTLEIASSPLGEVKISLSCNSALGGSNLHMPSLDELRELMEEKCLRSYKIIDPKFSVMKLMKDMCDCFLELATNSSHESQERIVNISPNHDLSKKSAAQGALAVVNDKGKLNMSSIASNGSTDVQYTAEVAPLQVQRPSQVVESPDDQMKTCRETLADGLIQSEGGKEKDHEISNSCSLVLVPHGQLTPDELWSLHNVNDITRGEERFEILWVNEISNEYPPSFYYISQNMVSQNASVNFTLNRIGHENCCPTCFGDCLSSAKPCDCACQNGGKFAYTFAGLVKEEFLEECVSMTRDPQHQFVLNCKECPLERSKNEEILEPCKGHLRRKIIKECWSKCGCNKLCGNRVVQRGIKYKLQVFFTPDRKGWGLRTLEKLPKGTFVCEFVGEILTIAELYERTSLKQSSPVMLDAYWGPEGVSEDNKALCLDATSYGNVARFINHRCLDANLIEIPVEVETPEHHYYHLAFFTTREVDALEELTWDYGIDFDDLEPPVKAFRCLCGSKFCRNMKRACRSKYAISGR